MKDAEICNFHSSVFILQSFADYLSLFKADVSGFEDTRGLAGVAPVEEIGGVGLTALFNEEDRSDRASEQHVMRDGTQDP